MYLMAWFLIKANFKMKLKSQKKGTGYPVTEPVPTGSGTGSRNFGTGSTGTGTGSKIIGPGPTGTGTGSKKLDRVPGLAHP